MKYTDAKKQIEALSSKYNAYKGEYTEYFNVYYKNTEVAYVSTEKPYFTRVWSENRFKQMPFSNNLYMILSELAMTPLDERAEEKKYYVKVFQAHLNIRVIDNRPSINTSYENYAIHTKFTEKEIEQLKQRDDIPLDWNKVKLEETE